MKMGRGRFGESDGGVLMFVWAGLHSAVCVEHSTYCTYGPVGGTTNCAVRCGVGKHTQRASEACIL